MREHVTQQAALHPQPLPFSVFVTSETLTLLQIATSRAVSLLELRAANPHLPSTMDCSEPLPIGTVVELPPTLFAKGTANGASFSVRSMVSRMEDVQNQLNSLSMANNSQEQSFPGPSVEPPLQTLISSLVAESKRHTEHMLNDPEALKREFGVDWATVRVADVLDTAPFERKMAHVAQQFASTGLHSFLPENQAILSKGPVVRQGCDLTITRPLISHATTVALDFILLKPQSVSQFDETWRLPPSTSLTDLEALIDCPNRRTPYPHTKNSFFFINGTFYINDQHEGFVDLSLPIRTFDPSGQQRPNGAFGSCPVRSISTSVNDITVKLNEMCVYRHLGCCDHYFYLNQLHWVPSAAESAVPRRIASAPQRPKSCDMCSLLPATIATYNDCLAPQNPTLFCPSCFAVLHCGPNGEEEEYGYLKFELPPGTFF